MKSFVPKILAHFCKFECYFVGFKKVLTENVWTSFVFKNTATVRITICIFLAHLGCFFNSCFLLIFFFLFVIFNAFLVFFWGLKCAYFTICGFVVIFYVDFLLIFNLFLRIGFFFEQFWLELMAKKALKNEKMIENK